MGAAASVGSDDDLSAYKSMAQSDVLQLLHEQIKNVQETNARMAEDAEKDEGTLSADVGTKSSHNLMLKQTSSLRKLAVRQLSKTLAYNKSYYENNNDDANIAYPYDDFVDEDLNANGEVVLRRIPSHTVSYDTSADSKLLDMNKSLVGHDNSADKNSDGEYKANYESITSYNDSDSKHSGGPVMGRLPKPTLLINLPSDTSLSEIKAESPSSAITARNGAYGLDDSRVIDLGNGKKTTFNVSPQGTTFNIGEFTINESGLSTNDGDSDSAGLAINGNFGRYAMPDFCEIGALGNGASGVVVEAVHVPSLTVVALKMLPVYNKQKRQQVARELQVLYKNLTEMCLVDHSLTPSSGAAEGSEKDDSASQRSPDSRHCENVLSLFGAFIDPKSGMINLVIEYMDGGSLEDLVQLGGCQSESVLADIARQALRGLAYLHKHKSVHRDIKPANILCSTSGLIKIADFGISIVLDNTAGFAQSFVGTVCYMSPERINGEMYSFPSDIWSFGLTMLAVCFGKFPLQLASSNKGYWGMIKAICDESLPSPGPDFSAEFNSFVQSCLQKRPEDREGVASLLSSSFIESNSLDSSKSQLQEDLFFTEKINSRKNDRASVVSEPTMMSTQSSAGEEEQSGGDLTPSTFTPRRSDNDATLLSSQLTTAKTRRKSSDVKDNVVRDMLKGEHVISMIDAINFEHMDRILAKLAIREERKDKGSDNNIRAMLQNPVPPVGDERWERLSSQLHLPSDLVRLLVSARLGGQEPCQEVKAEAQPKPKPNADSGSKEVVFY